MNFICVCAFFNLNFDPERLTAEPETHDMKGELVSHLVFEHVKTRQLRLLKAPPLEEVVCFAPHNANERDHGKNV